MLDPVENILKCSIIKNSSQIIGGREVRIVVARISKYILVLSYNFKYQQTKCIILSLGTMGAMTFSKGKMRDHFWSYVMFLHVTKVSILMAVLWRGNPYIGFNYILSW